MNDEIKILNKNNFSIEVEQTYASNPGISYLDAILMVAENYDLDEAQVPKLLSVNLKTKLKEESIKANLVKGSLSNKLPI